MKKRILLIGAFDTKGEEYAYVRDLIAERGHRTLLVDSGIFQSAALRPDIPSSKVAEAGGFSLEKMREKGDRGKAVDAMITGVQKLVPKLYSDGEFDAVLALGGGAGTNIATAGMRELPVGVPKLMVSTHASSDVSTYVDVKDITMMYPVADIAGLNPVTRRILSNAAGAICGMAEQHYVETEQKPLIAASMFGVTTPCVTEVRRLLEKAGYEVMAFHATGTGGRAMEALIEDDYFAGVADITTTEWCDEVAGGVLTAGPDRLGAAGRKGIPQVVSCGALDMVNFLTPDTIPDKFKSRTFYKHNPTVTLMRTSPEECGEIGKRIAEKLNQSSGPVVLMIPLKGVSAIDKKGEPFFDPKANNSLFDALHKHTNSSVKVLELDLHINDPEFAEAVAEELLQLF
ncbi:MAG: Tm-1-like ATP-binding domain-containing protein [Balneolaceae bacterium]